MKVRLTGFNRPPPAQGKAIGPFLLCWRPHRRGRSRTPRRRAWPMRVSVFVTCLADQFRPEAAAGLVRVLQRLGVSCRVPASQICCGHPAFTAGCPAEARVVGRRFCEAFRDADHVVAPSGSCVAMAKLHLPRLFPPGSPTFEAAQSLAGRIHELSDFLVNVLEVDDVGARFPYRVAYHDGCQLLRELRIREQPRRLLARVQDLTLVELPGSETCCGFGGMFAVKYPELSAAIGHEKLAALERSGAEYLVASDTGCLMHLGGLLARAGMPMKALHLAEVLAHER